MCDARAKFAIGMPKITFLTAASQTARSLRSIRSRVCKARAGGCADRVFREKPQDRVDYIFGTALGGVCKAEEQYIRYLKKGARGVQPTLAVQVFGGSAHSNIAIDFGFRGVGTTNSNSCASGTVSVGEALRYIRDDFADVIVAGGAEAPLTAITIGAFDIIKTMSRWSGEPALACRPFDALRDGFVMGEGGASLVVEELEHARARGAHIYAEVLGLS